MKKLQVRPLHLALLMAVVCLIFVIEAFTAQHLDYVLPFVGYGGTFADHDLKILGIPAYWFMMLCGFTASLWISQEKKDVYGLTKAESWLLPTGFLIVSYIGGKLLYVLENLDSVIAGGISFSGLSLFGAIFTVPVVFILISRSGRLKFSAAMDLCAIFGLLLLSCVRTGCFLNGCCGAKTIWSGLRPIILPVQLIEVVMDLLILEVCFAVERRCPRQGRMYPILMVGYGLCRFFLEFLRKGSETVLGLPSGQVLAIMCATIGLILLIRIHKKTK